VPSEYEPTREPFLKKWFFGISARAEREEKVLQYIIHRMNEETSLHDVIREDYVRRNCSQDKIHEIVNDPELVHACREHLWRTFRSGELDPGRGRSTSQPPTNSSPADGEDVRGPTSPDA
jgi:hypothetical protein